jgi:hypothetical protein
MHCGAEVTESSTNKQHHLWPGLFMLGSKIIFCGRRVRRLRLRSDGLQRQRGSACVWWRPVGRGSGLPRTATWLPSPGLPRTATWLPHPAFLAGGSTCVWWRGSSSSRQCSSTKCAWLRPAPGKLRLRRLLLRPAPVLCTAAAFLAGNSVCVRWTGGRGSSAAHGTREPVPCRRSARHSTRFKKKTMPQIVVEELKLDS